MDLRSLRSTSNHARALLVLLAVVEASCASTIEQPIAYFPPTAFAEDYPGSRQFRERWYSKHLQAAREPSLYEAEYVENDVYRFTFLPSFAHPIVVRIERAASGVSLFVKRLSRQGGSEPGTLEVNNVKTVSEGEWRLAEDAHRGVAFAHEKREVEENGAMRVCLDGEEWIFESRIKGAYQVVARQSPTRCSSCDELGLVKAGIAFFRLGSFDDVANVFAEAETRCAAERSR